MSSYSLQHNLNIVLKPLSSFALDDSWKWMLYLSIKLLRYIFPNIHTMSWTWSSRIGPPSGAPYSCISSKTPTHILCWPLFNSRPILKAFKAKAPLNVSSASIKVTYPLEVWSSPYCRATPGPPFTSQRKMSIVKNFLNSSAILS
jgi:hypothetical protein